MTAARGVARARRRRERYTCSLMRSSRAPSARASALPSAPIVAAFAGRAACVRRAIVSLVALAAIVGCEGGAVGDSDAGARDAATAGRDAQAEDASVPGDDAATSDGGTHGPDAGAPDAGRITRVVVRYAAGAGTTIGLRGSGGGLSWTTTVAMAPGAEPDTFVWETSALAASIEWKPLLEGASGGTSEAWAIGPNYHLAPGEHVEIAPRFDPAIARGRVVTLDPAFASAIVGGVRPILAYLPPSYDENDAASYPVVYMHDGQNLFDASTAAFGVEWRVDETMDAASSSGLCPDRVARCQNDGECGGERCDTFREAIVIGVGNTSARIDEYTPTADAGRGAGGRAGEYLRALIEEVRPAIDGSLRTRTGREDTALVGSSLGGLVSAWSGIQRPDVFGLIGALSPSTWWDERMLIDEVATIPGRGARALRVYVDSGDAGPSGDDWMNTRDLAAAYRAVGYVDGDDLEYVLAPGHVHTESDWARRLPHALEHLLGPRERPLP